MFCLLIRGGVGEVYAAYTSYVRLFVTVLFSQLQGLDRREGVVFLELVVFLIVFASDICILRHWSKGGPELGRLSR